MDCSEERDGEILILVPDGRIDSKTAKDFETALLGRVEAAAPAILVDGSRLDFISSAGLRVLLMAAKRQKSAGARFALCGIKDNIREVLEVSGFDRILAIWPDRAQAVANLR
jgi:anti-sigma B factor antagonist